LFLKKFTARLMQTIADTRRWHIGRSLKMSTYPDRAAALQRQRMLQTVALAQALIKDPRNWTARYRARTRFGMVCGVYSPRAARFCAYGALQRAARYVMGSRKESNRLADAIHAYQQTHVIRGQTVMRINDQRGHGAALSVLERTAERLR
jgi:hypothetical protein